MKNMDADGDGRVAKAEFTGKPKAFGFMDANSDGYLSREELDKGLKRIRQRKQGGGGPASGGSGPQRHAMVEGRRPAQNQRRKKGGGGLSAEEILAVVSGKTLIFNAPSNGQELKVYFAPGGTVQLVSENNPNRIIRKKWFLNKKGRLCRTVGRQNRNHCTIVKKLGDGKLKLSNPKKGFSYEAQVKPGKALGG